MPPGLDVRVPDADESEHGVDLVLILEGGPDQLFRTEVANVDEDKWHFQVKKLLVFWLAVACCNLVLVKVDVGDLNQTLVHAVLRL